MSRKFAEVPRDAATSKNIRDCILLTLWEMPSEQATRHGLANQREWLISPRRIYPEIIKLLKAGVLQEYRKHGRRLLWFTTDGIRDAWAAMDRRDEQPDALEVL
jgi:hypothetical protein